MRIFLCECKKFISFRVFWVIFACLAAVNGYIQIDRINDKYYDPESYRTFFEKTKAMTLDEIQAYTDDLLERNNNGEYIEFPMMLIYDMHELSKECENYPEYLKNIKEQTENMSAVSIWGDSDTFSYRNIRKTPHAYESLSAKPLPLATSIGLEHTFTSPMTDFMGIFLVFMAVCGIILKDREQGMTPLLSALPKGRASLILSKLAAASLFASVIAALLFAENLIIGGALYGIGDLQRPIQSVFGFYQCNLNVSLGEFLVLFFMLKMASYMLFAVMFSFICTVSKNNLIIYSTCGIICVTAFLCYKFVPANSVLQLLHYWNPVKFTQTAEILRTYQNVNLFGYPVSLKISALLLMAAAIAFMIYGCVYAVERLRNVQYRAVRFTAFRRKKSRIHSSFYYICYRSLILNKGIALALAAIFSSAMLSASFSRHYNNDDIYYENFTTELSGRVNSEMLDFLAEKEKRYAQVEREIEQIQSLENANIYKLNLLSNELNDRTAFERLKERVEAIQSSSVKGEIFYDTGYERIFGYEGSSEKVFMILFMALVLVLILSPLASTDRKTDMIKVIFATKCGKSGYYKQLFLYSILCGAFVGLMFFLPYMINIFNDYGMQGFTAPAQSIRMLSGLGIPLSVGGFTALFLTLHSLGAAVAAAVISGISSLCRSRTAAYIINSALFIVPVILWLMLMEINESL